MITLEKFKVPAEFARNIDINKNMKIRKHTYNEDIDGKQVNECKEYLRLIAR